MLLVKLLTSFVLALLLWVLIDEFAMSKKDHIIGLVIAIVIGIVWHVCFWSMVYHYHLNEVNCASSVLFDSLLVFTMSWMFRTALYSDRIICRVVASLYIIVGFVVAIMLPIMIH